MNDRYLYKAKKKNWRELPTEEQWVVGYIVHRPTGEWEILGKCNNPPDCDPMWRKVLIAYEIDPTTLCACTGLKDKNGKPIWENDVVRYCDCTVENYVIAWEPDKVCFEYQQYGCSIMNFDELSGIEAEVVGNIFDNPELLEVEE